MVKFYNVWFIIIPKGEIWKNFCEYENLFNTIPRDGDYYSRDMKYIFSNSVLSDMEEIHTDGTIEKLKIEIENDVNLYFNK